MRRRLYAERVMHATLDMVAKHTNSGRFEPSAGLVQELLDDVEFPESGSKMLAAVEAAIAKLDAGPKLPPEYSIICEAALRWVDMQDECPEGDTYLLSISNVAWALARHSSGDLEARDFVVLLDAARDWIRLRTAPPEMPLRQHGWIPVRPMFDFSIAEVWKSQAGEHVLVFACGCTMYADEDGNVDSGLDRGFSDRCRLHEWWYRDGGKMERVA